ncbi:MAG: GspE/PulE family protein [Desulfovibrionaceae bacterium]
MINLADLPEEVIRAYLAFPQRNEFLPVRCDDGGLTVWVLRNRALPMADYMAWVLGMPLATEQPAEAEFYRVLEQALALWEEEHDHSQDENEAREELDSQELLGWSHEDAPIVRLVNKTLQQAISQGASDVHFEGQHNQFQVRFRLDGELHTLRTLDKALQPTILARIKVMGDMDVAECRAPQDGRIQVRLGQKDVDIRVSTVPTLNGEKAVLRVLDRSKTILSLPDLGMPERELTTFRQVVGAPHGIVLVTGPTGSGKTTTLYAALSELVQEARNIMTVEDPVEYHLEGVNQVQVNRSAGVTFANTIRAFLRQDPDILLVGEVRDQETASTAIQASLTGHLVLTTLHTNDAPTAITRLLEMGLEPFLVASSLTLAMGQRLVRINCPHCSREVRVEDATLNLLRKAGETATTHIRGAGCEACFHTGFKGRRGIFELMPIDEELRSLIIQKASVDAFRAYRKAQGMGTMWEHGMRFVREGQTTYEEILRVTRL